jgi:hypothetical protein
MEIGTVCVGNVHGEPHAIPTRQMTCFLTLWKAVCLADTVAAVVIGERNGLFLVRLADLKCCGHPLSLDYSARHTVHHHAHRTLTSADFLGIAPQQPLYPGEDAYICYCAAVVSHLPTALLTIILDTPLFLCRYSSLSSFLSSLPAGTGCITFIC